jgi:hypothetical protein
LPPDSGPVTVAAVTVRAAAVDELATGGGVTDDAGTDVVEAGDGADGAAVAGADFALSEHAAVTARTSTNPRHLTPTSRPLPVLPPAR